MLETLRGEEALSVTSDNGVSSDVIGSLFESMFAHNASDWAGDTKAWVVMMREKSEMRESTVVYMLIAGRTTVFDWEKMELEGCWNGDGRVIILLRFCRYVGNW